MQAAGNSSGMVTNGRRYRNPGTPAVVLCFCATRDALTVCSLYALATPLVLCVCILSGVSPSISPRWVCPGVPPKFCDYAFTMFMAATTHPLMSLYIAVGIFLCHSGCQYLSSLWLSVSFITLQLVVLVCV